MKIAKYQNIMYHKKLIMFPYINMEQVENQINKQWYI